MSEAENEERTIIGNEVALRQFARSDGTCICSILQNKEGLFFFLIEQELVESATPASKAYSYWTETERSGLYDSLSAAEAEARAKLEWLNPGV